LIIFFATIDAADYFSPFSSFDTPHYDIDVLRHARLRCRLKAIDHYFTRLMPPFSLSLPHGHFAIAMPIIAITLRLAFTFSFHFDYFR
jgi:hypothetical protein